jgi:Zn-dependent M28 family amino/carboxypeptidase
VVVLIGLLLATLAGCGGDAVDGERALARVVHQVAAGPRVPGTPGHAAILRWIQLELERTGGRVELQSETDFTLGRPLELTNIVGRFGPTSGPRVALCAHWDSRPVSDRDPDSTLRSQPLPGANDGGSGVAVLLELAELMSRRPPRVGVDLVFFDGEDQADAVHPNDYCLGSRAFARRARPDRNQPSPYLAAFVFDMVGDKDLAIYQEGNSVQAASNVVQLVADAARATHASHFHSESRYVVYDDHVPLLQVGIPAVDLIDFDYTAWHTTHDLPDQVSAASLAEVARVAAWLIYQSPLAHP